MVPKTASARKLLRPIESVPHVGARPPWTRPRATECREPAAARDGPSASSKSNSASARPRLTDRELNRDPGPRSRPVESAARVCKPWTMLGLRLTMCVATVALPAHVYAPYFETWSTDGLTTTAQASG